MIQYGTQARRIQRRVFFTGTGALVKGQGLCYDRDRGTATAKDGTRDVYVELPSTSNNRHFAGVAAQDYGANSGGQGIMINEPGSVCEVAVGVDTVVDTTIMTCSANAVDAGRFGLQGFIGRGSALALQTNASGVLSSDYSGTAALDAAGTTLTHTGIGTAATVGDKVYILAGADDNTNLTIPIATTVATAPTADTITLAAAASDGGAMTVSFYMQTGNQTCLAYLFDGRESGLQKVYQITNGANTGLLVPGMNYIHGVFTPSADATETIGDGAHYGELWGCKLLGTLTTNDYLLTVGGIQFDGSTALATLEFDAGNDIAILEWRWADWHAQEVTGAAIA